MSPELPLEINLSINQWVEGSPVDCQMSSDKALHHSRKNRERKNKHNHHQKQLGFMGHIQKKRMGTQTHNFKGSMYIWETNGLLNNCEDISEGFWHPQETARKNGLFKKGADFNKKQGQM